MKMETRNVQTNANLLSLLGIGEEFRRLADPEGILSEGQVAEFLHSAVEKGAGTWRLTFAFENGEQVCVTGSVTKESLSFGTFYFPDRDGRRESFKLNPGKTFVRSIGDLSGLPSRLKRCLSVCSNAEPAGPEDLRKLQRFFLLEKNAIFWNVEGGEKDSGLRERFTSFSVRFQYSGNDSLVKAVFTAVAPLSEGRVVLTMDADVYGLGAKKTALYRNVGMGRFFEADCVVRKEGVFRPSLTAAFDIDARLPVFYMEERNLRKERDKTPKEKVPQRDEYAEGKNGRNVKKDAGKEIVRHEQKEFNERAARNNNHPKLK